MFQLFHNIADNSIHISLYNIPIEQIISWLGIAIIGILAYSIAKALNYLDR